MADHWKSLANKLGAPGVDEPEQETPKADLAEEAASKSSFAKPHGEQPADDEPSAPRPFWGSASEQSDADDAVETHTVARPPRKPARELDEADRELSFKNLSGSASSKSSDRTSRTSKPPRKGFGGFFEDESVQQDRSPADEGETTPEEGTQINISQVSAAEQKPSVSDSQSEAKPKRKSSWDKLASMWSIMTGPQAADSPPESESQTLGLDDKRGAAAEKASSTRLTPDYDADAPTSRRSSGRDSGLSIFSEEPASDPNDALDKMFGDAPRGKSSMWGPSKPRIVDDLGWDDDSVDQPEASAEYEADFDEDLSFSAKRDVESLEDSEDEPPADEAAPRRGRRRRRRGRRGRPEGEETQAKSEPASKEFGWGLSDDAVDADDESDVTIGWNSPETFAADDEIDDEAPEANVDEAERRSSRRRRRGRGRSEETSKRRPAGFEPEDDDSVDGIGAQRDLDFVADREPARGQRSPRDRDKAEEPASGGRSRERIGRDSEDRDGGRSRRSTSSQEARPSRGRSQESTRSGPPPSDTSEVARRGSAEPEFDSEDLDDEDRIGGKHKNIPTWADSIESLVQANMDNRRRSDNRSGPPRGRPRGRR